MTHPTNLRSALPKRQPSTGRPALSMTTSAATPSRVSGKACRNSDPAALGSATNSAVLRVIGCHRASAEGAVVLRHELAILRRTKRRPPTTAVDRLFLAAASRFLLHCRSTARRTAMQRGLLNRDRPHSRETTMNQRDRVQLDEIAVSDRARLGGLSQSRRSSVFRRP
jgi:hypothetical protein